jgi:hypothetical protein
VDQQRYLEMAALTLLSQVELMIGMAAVEARVLEQMEVPV